MRGEGCSKLFDEEVISRLDEAKKKLTANLNI